LALGASKGDLVRMILAAVLLPVSVGLVIGLAAALLGARFTQSVLFGVTARDPATYVTSVVALLLVATTAAALPARAAACADPLLMLRQE
jgi:ABC-type antimicrobial peptide transport system permease subunit